MVLHGPAYVAEICRIQSVYGSLEREGISVTLLRERGRRLDEWLDRNRGRGFLDEKRECVITIGEDFDSRM